MSNNWLVPAEFVSVDNVLARQLLLYLKSVIEQTKHTDMQLPIVRAHGLVILTEADFVEWFDGEVK